MPAMRERQARLRERRPQARGSLSAQDRARRGAARPLVHLPPLSQGAGLARPGGRRSGSAFPTWSPRPPTRRSRRAGAGTSGIAPSPTRSGSAALILQPNPADAECVLPLLDAPERHGAAAARFSTRRRSARRIATRAAPRSPRCSASMQTSRGSLTVAMMRDDQKLLVLSLPRRGAVAARRSAVAARRRRRRTGRGRGARSCSRRSASACAGRACLRPTQLKQLYRAADLYRLAGGQGGVGHGAARGAGGRASRRRRAKRRRAERRRRRRDRAARAEGDARAFAEAVGALLADPDRRAAHGQRGDASAPRASTTSPAPPTLLDATHPRADGRAMTPLLVIRHGPTDWNEAGLIQGRTDRPLSRGGTRASSRRCGCRRIGRARSACRARCSARWKRRACSASIRSRSRA